jgi:DNA-binding XRE family transcriptional regulator
MNLPPSRSAVAAWRRFNEHADMTPLRRARVEARVTQVDLARYAGLHVRTVIRAEQATSADAVSRGTWHILATTLRRPMDEILP